jgi:hypothetical protein
MFLEKPLDSNDNALDYGNFDAVLLLTSRAIGIGFLSFPSNPSNRQYGISK